MPAFPCMLSEYTKAEEQHISTIAESINWADPSLTLTYGAETMQDISRFADSLLSRVQAKNAGEIGDTLTTLMVQVKDVDVTDITRSPSLLESLPFVGSFFHSARRTVAKFQTLAAPGGSRHRQAG